MPLDFSEILVTGGAGFIGSHIVDRLLDEGFRVRVIDNLSTGFEENINSKAKFIKEDICSKDVSKIFEKGNFDLVNHHAAQIDVRKSVDDPVYDANTNILGTINLMQNCVKFGVKKFMFASTGGAVYGEQEYFPADEIHPTNPCSPYGITKLASEYYLRFWKEMHGLDFAALRYGNVYGPRQDPTGEAGVIAIFTRAVLMGEPVRIDWDGEQQKDYVYVRDVARSNLLALTCGDGEPFCIGTGKINNCSHLSVCMNVIGKTLTFYYIYFNRHILTQFGKKFFLAFMQRIKTPEIFMEFDIGFFGQIYFPHPLVIRQKRKYRSG